MPKINSVSINQDDPKEKGMQLKLFDNVQFIYELALAQYELESLGVEFNISEDLRNFGSKKQDDIEYLKNRLAYFERVEGEITDYARIVSHNQTRSPNQYLTHWIYPYKGKYHPQMIRALLNVIGARKGNVILDPFIGSGTTAIAALNLKRNFIGYDISPEFVDLSNKRILNIKEQLRLDDFL